MAHELLMLVWILAIVFASSFVASLIPGRAVPEVVFFVFLGAILGPNGFGLVQETDSLAVISRLGLGFLFLLAGYELDPAELMGTMGRHAALSWLVSMALALAVTPLLGLNLAETGDLAFAIALTTTAYGTLVPIMRDRGLLGTPVGKVVESYGAMGELLPVLAMSVLLSPSRSRLASVIYLAVFVGLCVFVAKRAERAKRIGTKMFTFLRDNSEATTQPTVRTSVLLLVALLLLAEVMDLDAVLAAFAAGFILRYIAPDDKSLADRLQTVGNGFFIPIFFVCSGLGIDLSAVGADPLLLVLYTVLLLVVRGMVVAVSLSVFKETRGLTQGEKISASLYCTMALPLIVALTETATAAGAMSDEMASVLVTAGALTVLIIPIITATTRTVTALHPVEAAQEIRHNPDEARHIWEEHLRDRRLEVERFHEVVDSQRAKGRWVSSADYLARSRDVRKRLESLRTERAEQEKERRARRQEKHGGRHDDEDGK